MSQKTSLKIRERGMPIILKYIWLCFVDVKYQTLSTPPFLFATQSAFKDVALCTYIFNLAVIRKLLAFSGQSSWASGDFKKQNINEIIELLVNTVNTISFLNWWDNTSLVEQEQLRQINCLCIPIITANCYFFLYYWYSTQKHKYRKVRV